MSSELESKLSADLKNLCEPYGTKWKEKDPKESARIFHQLGLLYKKKAVAEQPHSLEAKIKFIQSAALLNCALVRKPLEAEQIEDLHQLCFDIIRAARGTVSNFDLVDFANTLKRDIEKWRDDVNNESKTIRRIPDEFKEIDLEQLEHEKIDAVESCQNRITDKYKSFMQQISSTVADELNECPCYFSLVGMGSIARKEITPYSDFENIIILQEGVQKDVHYEEILEYFRWYAVIFQVILINLGETILPSVAIPSLNDHSTENGDWFFDAYTKRGISFDGMMPHASKLPLGRTLTTNKPWRIELIKPVSEMVQFLGREQDLKNGYHLADILANTCFVHGSHDIYQHFEESVKNVLKDNQKHANNEVIEMVKDDMKKHSTKLSISSTIDKDSFNVKQFAYRSTTIFITGIAKIYNIKPGSCFAIIRRMQERKLISSAFSHKLQYAVALACELRLKTYLGKRRQDDNIKPSLEDENICSSLIQAVGIKSCYDYFEIACCLQYDVIAVFKLDKNYMYYHPVSMCIAISSVLRMYDRIITSWQFVNNHLILEDQPDVNSSGDKVYDVCGDDAGEDIMCVAEVYADADEIGVYGNTQNDDDVKENYDDAECLTIKIGSVSVASKRKIDKGFDKSIVSDFVADGVSKDTDVDDIWAGGCIGGTSKRSMMVGSDVDNSKENTCTVKKNGGSSYNDSESFKDNNKSIYKENDTNTEGKSNHFKNKVTFGTAEDNTNDDKHANVCHDRKKNVSELESHDVGCDKKNLHNRRSCVRDYTNCDSCHDKATNHHFDSTSYSLNLGNWFNRMQEFNLEFNKINSPAKGEIHSAIDALIDLGIYFYNKGLYQEAKDFLKLAIKMLKINNCKECLCHYLIGKCYFSLQKERKAIEYFQSSLTTFSSISDSVASLKYQLSVSDYFKEIAKCQQQMNLIEEACKNYTKALNGYKKCGGDHFHDASLCYRELVYCLHKLKDFFHAEDISQEWLKFISTISVMPECKTKEYKAVVHFCLGRSLLKLNRVEKALQCFDIALELYQSMKIKQPKVDSLKANCWFLKGESEWRINRPKEVLKSFSESLKLWKSLYEDFNDTKYAKQMVFCHDRISSYFHRQNSLVYAIDYATKALDFCKMCKNTKNTEMKLNRYLGKLHRDSKKYDEAFVYYNSALSIQQNLESDDLTDLLIIAGLYKDCGTCLKKLGNFPDASKHIQTALQRYQELLETQKLPKLPLLKEIGFCYWKLDNYPSAKDFLEKYVITYEESDLPSHTMNTDIAYILKRIAICWQKEKKWDTAKIYFDQSLKIFEALPRNPEYDIQIAYLYINIGDYYMVRKNYTEAKQYYQKSKLQVESLPQNPRVKFLRALQFENFGKLYKFQKLYPNAVKCFENAISIIDPLPDHLTNTRTMANLLQAIGFCFQFQNKFLLSIDYFERSLECLKKLSETIELQMEIAFFLKVVAQNFLKMQENKKAICHFNKAVEVYSSIKDKLSEPSFSSQKQKHETIERLDPREKNYFQVIASVQESQAGCCLAKNEFSKATEYYQNAVGTYLRHFPDTQKRRRNIQWVKSQISQLRK